MKIDVSEIVEWLGKNPLPVSLAVNVLLVVAIAMLESGWSFSYVDGKLEVKQTISPEQHVDALFKDDRTRAQARGLLRKQSYFELSATHIETEAIVEALGQLGAENKLVNELRDMSHRNKPPFEPRSRKVTLVLSSSPQIGRGEAAVCDHDAEELQSKFIEFFTRDDRNGIYVEAIRTRRCPDRNTTIVELSPADWRTLQLAGSSAPDADARVYLHRPYERLADDAPVVAHVGG